MRKSPWSIAPYVAVFWTLAVGIARAIRYPNDFAEAHWLLDYRFGFMKRGLAGSFFTMVSSVFGFERTPNAIMVVAAVTFLALVAVVLALFFRLLGDRPQGRDNVLVALVAASSPLLVAHAHFFGYMDVLLYVLTFIAVFLVIRNRPLPAAAFSVIAVLVHESFILTGLPIVALATVMACTDKNRRANRLGHVLGLAIPVAAFLAMTSYHMFFVDAPGLRGRLFDYLDAFGFVPTQSRHVPWHQTNGIFKLLSEQGGAYMARLLNPYVFTAVAPSIMAIIYYLHSAYRIRPFGLTSFGLLAAVCCPLAIHAVAWDTLRISTYLIGGSLLAAYVFSRTREKTPAGGMFVLLAVPVILLNMFYRSPLMDNEVERFSDLWRLVIYSPVIALVFFLAIRRTEFLPFYDKISTEGTVTKTEDPGKRNEEISG